MKFIIAVPYTEITYYAVEAENMLEVEDMWFNGEIEKRDPGISEGVDTGLSVDFHQEGEVLYDDIVHRYPSLGD